jgi:inorganic pyrophosphatase/exopolyphosphatase
MNIYLISQTENEDYDTYNSAVVYAPDEDTARNLHPSGW